MNIINHSKTEQNIRKIEESAKDVLLAIKSSIHMLNMSYQILWSLPDDELRDVLQYLVDNNKLTEVFGQHNFAANSLNSILENAGEDGAKALVAVPREFTIDPETNQVTIVPKPQEQVSEIIED
jgi:hypothetical protein